MYNVWPGKCHGEQQVSVLPPKCQEKWARMAQAEETRINNLLESFFKSTWLHSAWMKKKSYLFFFLEKILILWFYSDEIALIPGSLSSSSAELKSVHSCLVKKTHIKSHISSSEILKEISSGCHLIRGQMMVSVGGWFQLMWCFLSTVLARI